MIGTLCTLSKPAGVEFSCTPFHFCSRQTQWLLGDFVLYTGSERQTARPQHQLQHLSGQIGKARFGKQGPSLWVFEKSLDLVPQNSCHKTSYESQGPTNWTGQARHRHMGPENDERTMQAAYSLPSSPLCTSVQGKHSGCWVTLFCTLALNGKPRDPNINSSIFLGKLAKLALANKVRHCESSKKAWTSCHRTPAPEISFHLCLILQSFKDIFSKKTATPLVNNFKAKELAT